MHYEVKLKLRSHKVIA